MSDETKRPLDDSSDELDIIELDERLDMSIDPLLIGLSVPNDHNKSCCNSPCLI
jgi:hypothetical protein